MELKGSLSEKEWLTEKERAAAMEHADAFEEMFDQLGVARVPPLVWRTEGVIIQYIEVQRIEACLGNDVTVEDPATKRASPFAVIEAAGKAREQWRKAMKDLEEYCARVGTPIDQGLADVMKPVLKKAEGVLEDALAFEARKNKKDKKRGA